MAYLTGSCPRCGIKINFQESSVGTMRRCDACGQQFVLTAAPYSSGFCTAVLGLVIGGAIVILGCGGLLFLVAFTTVAVAPSNQPVAKTSKVAVEPPQDAADSKSVVAESKPVPDYRTWNDKSGKF